MEIELESHERDPRRSGSYWKLGIEVVDGRHRGIVDVHDVLPRVFHVHA